MSCPNQTKVNNDFFNSLNVNGLKLDESQKNVIGNAITSLNKLSNSTIIACDEKCEKQKRIDAALKRFREARDNYWGSPNNYEQARKNYFTEAYGASRYFDIIRQESAQDANQLITYIQSKVKDRQKIIDLLLSSYKNEYNEIPYLEDANKNYDKKFNNLFKRLGIRENQINISNRKVYYEDGVIKTYSWYSNKLSYISWILFLIYCLYVFAYLRVFNKKQIFVTIGLAIILIMIQYFTFKLVDIYNTWMKVENEFCELEDFGDI